MLKNALTCLCATAALVSASSFADREALADDGREIILKDNGSWQYKNNDRLATSEDGTRVRLKNDGSWVFIGNAPVASEHQVVTESLDIELDKVVTEFTKVKTSAKTKRYNSQTVFHLNINVSSYGNTVKPNLNDFSQFVVRDDKDTQYPVIAINQTNPTWTPGSDQILSIRVDGSPSGSIILGSTKITLTIDRAVFGSNADLTFTERTNEIKKKRVNKLTAF